MPRHNLSVVISCSARITQPGFGLWMRSRGLCLCHLATMIIMIHSDQITSRAYVPLIKRLQSSGLSVEGKVATAHPGATRSSLAVRSWHARPRTKAA
eukprot:6184374-Pleurochrysis_carterae.AAC.2